MPELQETSPYGSRVAIVEDDGRTVYLYLLPPHGSDSPSDIKAVWVANRAPAPDAEDRASMELGQAPLMPRTHTRHPVGLPAFRAEDLELLWFEEGDGVALLERGLPLAVLPSWSGTEGFQGYAREAAGQSSLAWDLSEALAAFGLRIESARRYWEWRATEGSWATIRDAGVRHLEQRLGPHCRYWAADGGRFPPRAVLDFQPAEYPGVSVCATVGMSAQPMPGVELYLEQPASYRRIELAMATDGDPVAAARLLSQMTAFPWAELTWLGEGHTYSWEPLPELAGVSSALLLQRPPLDGKQGLFRRGAPAPDLFGLVDRSGDPVTFLWVVPIRAAELELAQEHGSGAVIRELERRRQSWVWRGGGQ